MAKVSIALGRAATDGMLACDQPVQSTPVWRASAVEAGDGRAWPSPLPKADDADPGRRGPAVGAGTMTQAIPA